MWNPFDWAIDPNMTPEQVAQKRARNANASASLGSADYAASGLAQMLLGIKLGSQDRKLDDLEQKGRAGADSAVAGLYQPMTVLGPTPMPPVDPNSPKGIAADAMRAIGKLPDFGAVETQYGLPQGYLSEVAQIESGMNPRADNPNSSAGGLFQFIDATASQYGLQDKMDPFAATDAAARLAADNAKALRKALGREPTKGELYLAHQQGAGGAIALLSNPDAKAESIVGADAIRLNGGSAGMTAGEFANKWTSKLKGNTPQAVTGQIPTAKIYEALQNPWLTPEQRQMLTGMLETQQNAPMEALRVQAAQQDLAAAEMQMVGGDEYGLTPVYGRDKDGNIVVMQLGKSGSAVATALPEGVTPDLAVKSEEAARGAETGKQTATAKMELQTIIDKSEAALALIEDVRNDPALSSITGIVQGGVFAPGIPMISGGQAGKDLATKVDQLKGQAFLEAFQSLKGGGQITQVEGEKATAAMARLNLAQSTEAYQKALDDLAEIVKAGLERAKDKAQRGGTEPASPPAPPADDPLGIFE